MDIVHTGSIFNDIKQGRSAKKGMIINVYALSQDFNA